MDVRVTFDPCSLREHDWQMCPVGFQGLLFGAETCSRCGETRYPDASKMGGIDRTENKFWRAYQPGS